MPQMVMSQLPKHRLLVMTRRRLKGAKDRIVPINYMYVGIPKTKFTFYVRERLVYRSSVEVTFDDVFNYLAQVCNDSSISLHYTVNNQYVSITTTGQLHTFLQHIHNDPNMFLYLENKDYVWNVKPKNKSHKKKKQDGEVEDTLRKRKCECEHHRDEEDDADDMTSDEDVSSYLSDEESSEDCSDIDGDDQETVCETSEEEESSPNINKLEKPGKTVESDTSACSGASSGSAGLGAEEDDNDEQISCEPAPAASNSGDPNTDIDDMKRFIKKVIEIEDGNANLSRKRLQPYCELIARKLISSFWPIRSTRGTVFRERTVLELTFVVRAHLCIYYNLLKERTDRNILFDKFTLAILEKAFVIIEQHIRLFHMLSKIDVMIAFEEGDVEKCKFDHNLPSVEFVRSILKQTALMLKVAGHKSFVKETCCRCIEPIEVFGKKIDQFHDMLAEFDNLKKCDVEKYRKIILQINREAVKFADRSCDSHAKLEELVEGDEVKAEILKSFGIATSDTSEDDESVDERVTSKPVPRKDLSPEVQEHIDNMLKIPQHTYVYPPIPSPGKIMVPTGGLARCRCSKTCTFYLNEPEYACLERFNEPRQSLLEKTKQKRFKKN